MKRGAELVEELTAFLVDAAPPPADMLERLDAKLSQTRVKDCDCGMITCVCEQARQHKQGCRFRRALTLPFSLECDHNYDVCPKCDPCTCESLP